MRGDIVTLSPETYRLRGFTCVRVLSFETDPRSGECTLTLTLVSDEARPADEIEATFFDVANLSLRDFGGGITQLLQLAIEDISHLGLDRTGYRVTELERDSISFTFRRLEIKP